MQKFEIVLERLNEDQVLSVARQLARCLRPGDILLLSGEIGAGKTTFTRGLVEGLGGDSGVVTSPTFTLLNVYNCRETVYHVDAYRLGSIEEAFYVIEGELELGEGIFVIEWGERIKELFDENLIVVELRHVDSTHRDVIVTANNVLGDRVRRCFEGAKEK
ncbi:tRNA (adenosine(37)-N6)-threonylcarbamoyltransferase complex ATPase subunit type 1 TsaE [Fervidobacterium thailandense]|uniref:tRNA threonylcarbamoyladenosine biosynthesis protein TsaE n=1 Tax=Fervidobacterium thailandense TaxID=1008305 RepID=A0A1E3G4W9_9BACT|nr:tRNA (adenosine(37)-N6)-threonylcarbamoyltransferase complex ATPase subunit type 1 TsaE [Fervidobacterium thailandense]ODN30883.1 tRNA threonylcarbamoyladenosine biosynthesis protein TsaE [Fervidobacterium thailandense]